MVKTLSTSLTDFDRLFLGFDRLQSQLMNNPTTDTNYPRYNIVAGKEHYRLEIDVAGLEREGISVVQDQQELIVKGKKTNPLLEDGEKYVYKGISGKAFTKIFSLGDWIKVDHAQLIDGLLVVFLIVDKPEELRPQNIDIN
jgi:molecular chaperone IbpA|tara:strand:+ start:112 stop:534 length:423 start_codon:yes stop_codon:yes gene_type:complete